MASDGEITAELENEVNTADPAVVSSDEPESSSYVTPEYDLELPIPEDQRTLSDLLDDALDEESELYAELTTELAEGEVPSEAVLELFDVIEDALEKRPENLLTAVNIFEEPHGLHPQIHDKIIFLARMPGSPISGLIGTETSKWTKQQAEDFKRFKKIMGVLASDANRTRAMREDLEEIREAIRNLDISDHEKKILLAKTDELESEIEKLELCGENAMKQYEMTDALLKQQLRSIFRNAPEEVRENFRDLRQVAKKVISAEFTKEQLEELGFENIDLPEGKTARRFAVGMEDGQHYALIPNEHGEYQKVFFNPTDQQLDTIEKKSADGAKYANELDYSVIDEYHRTYEQWIADLKDHPEIAQKRDIILGRIHDLEDLKKEMVDIEDALRDLRQKIADHRELVQGLGRDRNSPEFRAANEKLKELERQYSEIQDRLEKNKLELQSHQEVNEWMIENRSELIQNFELYLKGAENGGITAQQFKAMFPDAPEKVIEFFDELIDSDRPKATSSEQTTRYTGATPGSPLDQSITEAFAAANAGEPNELPATSGPEIKPATPLGMGG